MAKQKITIIDALKALKASSGQAVQGELRQINIETEKEFCDMKITNCGHMCLPLSALDLGERRTAIQSTDYTQSSEIVDFAESLQPKSILAQLGAKFLTGLGPNALVPVAEGTTVAWEGEVDEGHDANPTVTSHQPKPLRIGAFIAVSNTVLVQTRNNPQVNNFINNEIILAIISAVEAAAINGSGIGQPKGLLKYTGIGSIETAADGMVPVKEHLIALEKAVALQNADSGQLAFLTNPLVRAKLKNMPLDNKSGVWDFNLNNTLMGYKAGVTTSVPSNLTKGVGTDLSAIIFGNFADLLLLQWGGFDVVMDPYSLKNFNTTFFTINTYWNTVVKREKSFAAMVDVITE